jgi:hypothetical protein
MMLKTNMFLTGFGKIMEHRKYRYFIIARITLRPGLLGLAG